MEIIKTPEVSNITVPSRSVTDGNDIELAVIDEETRVTNDIAITANYANGELTFSIDFGGVDGRYYYVVATQSGRELTKFKMYCTNQTELQDYSITEGDFIEAPEGDNEFIVLD